MVINAMLCSLGLPGLHSRRPCLLGDQQNDNDHVAVNNHEANWSPATPEDRPTLPILAVASKWVASNLG